MSTAPGAPDVGAILPSTSSPRQRRRVLYNKPEPCYCKINQTTGLIALSLTSFKTLHEKKPLKEQLTILHGLHLQLDAIVTQHKAVKFSGSSESYLVAKCCESETEAAFGIKNIAEDLMSVNKDLKGVVSFGEIGFALLGSTAWNYQFYGEMVSDLKTKAEEQRPGELYMMPCLIDVLQKLRKMHDASPSTTSPPPATVHTEITSIPFHEWWASRVQYTDIWVLILTFLFAAVSVWNQIQMDDRSKIHLVSLFLQVQCCIVNVFAALNWLVNRKWFIRQHSFIMSVVWCTQFFSRVVQAWTRLPYACTSQTLSVVHQLIAMNGPEKILLMTAPVNFWICLCLHWIGFFGSVGTVYSSCFGGDSLPNAQLPSKIWTTAVISFVVFFVLPVVYSIRVESEAKRAFAQLQSSTKTNKG